MTTTPSIEELVKRLRCNVTGNPCGTDTRPIGSPCTCKSCEVHSALEAQAARVRELEKDVKIKTETGGLLAAAHLQNRARIAELEARISDLKRSADERALDAESARAQVEAFREAATRIHDLAESSFSVAHETWFQRIPLVAFDALMAALAATQRRDAAEDRIGE